MRIWKYDLEITDRQHIVMPAGAELLSVANQNGNLCLWAMVDESAQSEERTIEIIGTGNSMPTGMGVDRAFIGTAVINPFVWHVFERK